VDDLETRSITQRREAFWRFGGRGVIAYIRTARDYRLHVAILTVASVPTDKRNYPLDGERQDTDHYKCDNQLPT